MGKPNKIRIRHHYKLATVAKIKTTDDTKIDTNYIITVVRNASLYMYSRQVWKFFKTSKTNQLTN